MIDNEGTIEKAREAVSEYAEKNLGLATRMVDLLLDKKKAIDRAEVENALDEYNSWFGFVRGKKEKKPGYLIKDVSGGKAKIVPPRK